MLRQHSNSLGDGRNASRPVKMKGEMRVIHEVSTIFTKEKTISSLEVAEMVGKEHKELLIFQRDSFQNMSIMGVVN